MVTNKIANKINLFNKNNSFNLFNKMVYVNKITTTKTYSKAFKPFNLSPLTKGL